MILCSQASCGRMQSGYYLDGVAPDGLLGLGFGAVSVPSFLARTGSIHDSFSLCFRDDDSGRILFGDKGPSTQQSTSFITVDGKMYVCLQINHIIISEPLFHYYCFQNSFYMPASQIITQRKTKLYLIVLSPCITLFV